MISPVFSGRPNNNFTAQQGLSTGNQQPVVEALAIVYATNAGLSGASNNSDQSGDSVFFQNKPFVGNTDSGNNKLAQKTLKQSQLQLFKRPKKAMFVANPTEGDQSIRKVLAVSCDGKTLITKKPHYKDPLKLQSLDSLA